jgi:hypothetical protein
MKVVILQPSYIPWRGYLHQIKKADLFVFYDCVQYDDQGWRNRNKIKIGNNAHWLTVPVNSRNCQAFKTPIKDKPIFWNTLWNDKHLQTLKQNYVKAPFFRSYESLLENIYSRKYVYLLDFTCFTTELIARELGFAHTQFE